MPESPSAQTRRTAAVTTDRAGRGELARLADQLLPALIARLGTSSLGELEVAEGDWRIRLRRAPARAPASSASTRRGAATAQLTAGATASDGSGHVALSPAVGYFSPRPGAAVGHPVSVGDVLGWVDVLGVRQDVVAPTSGSLGRFLVEPGQAVEYGQGLILVDVTLRVEAAVVTVVQRDASDPDAAPMGQAFAPADLASPVSRAVAD